MLEELKPKLGEGHSGSVLLVVTVVPFFQSGQR